MSHMFRYTEYKISIKDSHLFVRLEFPESPPTLEAVELNLGRPKRQLGARGEGVVEL
jgi:hypothetical protein